MHLTWTFSILSLLICANGLAEDQLESFLSLTKYGYEDSCTKSSEYEWSFINEPTNKTRLLWESAANEYALYKIQQVNETSGNKVEIFNDTKLEYAYNTVIKPGDALLENDDFHKLVSFIGQSELSRLTGYYTTGTTKHLRQDVERQLARNGNPKGKLEYWSEWHEKFAPMAANFSEILPLVEKAATANGKNGIEEYWEMLSGYENGYEHAKNEWDKISSVHNKILEFVKNRLSRKYADLIVNNSLPAHLLGSLRGYDWTSLAMDVVPYNDITYSIRKKLWEKEIVGENLYKEASKLGNVILKHVPLADFWKESDFHGQCPSHLINLCRDGKMRISTCSEASIENFISAHKNVGKILVTQLSHHTEPILNFANRYSALEEGVAELFGVLSVSHAWLNSRGLIENSVDLDEIRIVSLMITALDILPRMAYYIAADRWRIDTIENKTFEANNLASTWWKYRMEYEGISTDVPDLPTFLDDDYITSNRPYLSKFLGTILGFQIYEYLMESTEVRYETILPSSGNNHYLARMIRQGFANNWTEVIKKYLELDEINADSLLAYFSSLIDHIDEEAELSENLPIPEEQERDLDFIADKYRKKFNTPTTTTTTTTTTTEKPMRPKPVGESSKDDVKKIQPPKSLNSEKIRQNATSAKNVEIPPANKTKEVPIQTESIQSEGTGNSEEKPKTNTSKAVWAVAAVLIATITICIIAIFGRRRCRKAPKNRRYV